MNMKQLKRIPRWLVSSIFFGLVIIFFAFYLKGINYAALGNLTFDWRYFGVATALGLAFLFLGAFIWRVILRALGANHLPVITVTNSVYARSWMGRYIPGTVTWIAAKVYLASTWGISKSRLSVASLLEAGSQVLAFTFLGFVLLGFDQRFDVVSGPAKIGLVIMGLLAVIVLVPVVFNRLLGIAFKLIGRRTASDELRINGRAVSRSFVLYVIGGMLYGASSLFIIKTIAPDFAFENLGFVIGAIALSTVAGMAAPFAPGGIGIKDGLQLILLTTILPKETALAATIMIRLWSVAIDVLFLGITSALNRKHKQEAHAPVSS